MSVSVLLVPYSPVLQEELERQFPDLNPFRQVQGVKPNKKVVSLFKVILKIYPILNADKLCLLAAHGKGEDYVTMSHAGVTIGDFIEAECNAGSRLQSSDGNVAYVLRYALDATAAMEAGVVDLTPAMSAEYLAKTSLAAPQTRDASAPAVKADIAATATGVAAAPLPPRPPPAAEAAPSEAAGLAGRAPAAEASPAASSDIAAALPEIAVPSTAAYALTRGGTACRHAATASSSGAPNAAALWRQQSLKNKHFNRALSRAATARAPGEAAGPAAPTIRPTVCVRADEPRSKPREARARPPDPVPAARSPAPHEHIEAGDEEARHEAVPPAVVSRTLMSGLLLQPCEQSTDGFSCLSPMAGRQGDATSSGNSVFGELSTDGFGGSMLHEAPRKRSCGDADEGSTLKRPTSFSGMFSRLGGAAAAQPAAKPAQRVPPAAADAPSHLRPKGQTLVDGDAHAALLRPASAPAPEEAQAGGVGDLLAGALSRAAGVGGAASLPASWSRNRRDASSSVATAADASPALFAAMRGRQAAPSPPSGGPAWPEADMRGNDDSVGSLELFGAEDDSSPAAELPSKPASEPAPLRDAEPTLLPAAQPQSLPDAEPPSLLAAKPVYDPPPELQPAGGTGAFGLGMGSRQAAGESTAHLSQPASSALDSSPSAAVPAHAGGEDAAASALRHGPLGQAAGARGPGGDGTAEGGPPKSGCVVAEHNSSAGEAVPMESDGPSTRIGHAREAVEEDGEHAQLRQPRDPDRDARGRLSPSASAAAKPAPTPTPELAPTPSVTPPRAPAATPNVRRSSRHTATTPVARAPTPQPPSTPTATPQPQPTPAATPQPPTTPSSARSARFARRSFRLESREQGELSVEKLPRRTPQPTPGRATDRAAGSATRRKVGSPAARPRASSPCSAALQPAPTAPSRAAASPRALSPSRSRMHPGRATEHSQTAAEPAGGMSGNAQGDVSGEAARDLSRDMSRDVSGDVSQGVCRGESKDGSEVAGGDATGDAASDATVDASMDASHVTRRAITDAITDAAGDAIRDATVEATRDAASVVTVGATEGATGGAIGDAVATSDGSDALRRPGRRPPAAAGVPHRSSRPQPAATSAQSPAKEGAVGERPPIEHAPALVGESEHGDRSVTKKAARGKAERSPSPRHETARKKRHDKEARVDTGRSPSPEQRPVVSKKEAQQIQRAVPGASAGGGYRIRKKPARALAAAAPSPVDAPAPAARGRRGVAGPPSMPANPRDSPATAPLAEARPQAAPHAATDAHATGRGGSPGGGAASTTGAAIPAPTCGLSTEAVALGQSSSRDADAEACGESEDEMLTVAEIRAIGKRQRDTADGTPIGGGVPSCGQSQQPRPLSPPRPQPSNSTSRDTEPTGALITPTDPQPSRAPAKRLRAALSPDARPPAERQISPIRHALDPYLDAEIERDGEEAFLERTRKGALLAALRARAPDYDAGR